MEKIKTITVKRLAHVSCIPLTPSFVVRIIRLRMQHKQALLNEGCAITGNDDFECEPETLAITTYKLLKELEDAFLDESVKNED